MNEVYIPWVIGVWLGVVFILFCLAYISSERDPYGGRSGFMDNELIVIASVAWPVTLFLAAFAAFVLLPIGLLFYACILIPLNWIADKIEGR